MPPLTKSFKQARRLRREMTPPEIRLWMALRAGQTGLKFHRQHPLGPYILGFYCNAAALVVEVDGGSHDHPAQQSRDGRRDADFRARGIKTFCIPARAVYEDADGVVRFIADTARASTRFPLPPGEGHREAVEREVAARDTSRLRSRNVMHRG